MSSHTHDFKQVENFSKKFDELFKESKFPYAFMIAFYQDENGCVQCCINLDSNIGSIDEAKIKFLGDLGFNAAYKAIKSYPGSNVYKEETTIYRVLKDETKTTTDDTK